MNSLNFRAFFVTRISFHSISFCVRISRGCRELRCSWNDLFCDVCDNLLSLWSPKRRNNMIICVLMHTAVISIASQTV